MPRQSLRKKNRRQNHWRTGTDHQVDHPERFSDSDPATSGSMQEYHEGVSANKNDCLFADPVCNVQYGIWTAPVTTTHSRNHKVWLAIHYTVQQCNTDLSF